MSSTFPSVLTSYTNPASTSRLNSPSHAGIEQNQNSGLSQLEAVIGVEGNSSVVGTLEYFIKSPASNGGGHVQTANKGGTGQTTFTKGDILVASSSSVLTKLSVGSDGKGLKADSTALTGLAWGSSNTIPTVRVYSTPSVLTWSKPSVLSYIVVKVVGGGGSGGGAGGASGGGGGGAGGYSEVKIIASALGATVQVNVATSVTGSVGGVGINGKYSGFGGYASCLGGTGGTVGQGSNQPAAGGAGGAATLGDVNIAGGRGGDGVEGGTTFSIGGGGGSSPWGQGGAIATLGTAGTQGGYDGTGYGSGGGGSAQIGAGTSAGGKGMQGLVIVEEY